MKQVICTKNKILLAIIISVIVLSRTLISILNINNSIFIQQDNYTGYVSAMAHNTLASSLFPDYGRRLFPGLPILMYLGSLGTKQTLVAGIFISIVSSAGVAFLLWKLIKSPLPALLSIVLPPVWVSQGGKVATEPVFAALALFAVFLFLKKKYLLTGILIGLTVTIRPIGIVLLLSFAPFLFKQPKKYLLHFLVGFSLPILLFFIFNYTFFGSKEIFEQFIHGNRYGGFRLGFIQIAQDFYRTIAWKQYRIFSSGLFYVCTYLLALFMLYKKRNQSFLTKFSFLWMALSLLFILSPSPFTLLDNFGRYALAALPP